jgi:hypothetical protein
MEAQMAQIPKLIMRPSRRLGGELRAGTPTEKRDRLLPHSGSESVIMPITCTDLALFRRLRR